jgi:patatin-related protein
MQTQTTAPVPPLADPASLEYTAEIRFGVVMYGGVSLAIYINGVANELFEMACATPRSGVTLDSDKESFTREIYRRLSWLTGSPELRAIYARRIAEAEDAAKAPAQTEEPAAEPADAWAEIDRSDYTQTRLVIDVIAGTSAGGINGVFLAKALANGQQFSGLRDLWVNEGDIGLLLNDRSSYNGTAPTLADRSGKPTSLLNSDRMYAKLLYAMETMESLKVYAWPADKRGSPLVEEIDLFVTTTDIEGSAVPLRLFDKVVYERRYKQNYRFSYPNGVTQPSGNDFDEVNNPFLAFAARCTSSFPFAFEPMTLAAVARLKADGAPPGVKRWKAFFPNLPRDEVDKDAHEHRAFGDGGYLDNKPFTYVVETLSQRFSSVPLERKLVFVEPSPEQPDPHRLPDPRKTPDALENSIAALTRIPRYETSATAASNGWSAWFGWARSISTTRFPHSPASSRAAGESRPGRR